jgi:ribosomal protein S18
MEINAKKALLESRLYGLIKNFEILHRIISEKTPMKTSRVTTESYPYQLSKAYRKQNLEINIKISQALADAHRKRIQLF